MCVSQKYVILQVCESLLAFLTQLYQFEHAQCQQNDIMRGVITMSHSFCSFVMLVTNPCLGMMEL